MDHPPYLFIGNNEKDDAEAIRLLQKYGIDCEILFSPKDEETPAVLFNLAEYEGLKEIKRFVSKELML